MARKIGCRLRALNGPEPELRAGGLNSPIFSLLILALLLSFAVSARSQIASCREQQTVPPPSPQISPPAIGDRSNAAPAVALNAVLRGWSIASDMADELEPAVTSVDHPVTLDAGCLGIVFFFDATPAFLNAAEFRYRLTGYDSTWTVTRSHIAHYRKLSPGSYRFEVQATQFGGAWTSPPASLAVVQRSFFYQTWYFYLMLLGGLVVLAMQLLQQRDQLIKGEIGIVLEERNRIASDCHDTLMAGFAAISWQLEATAKLFRDDGNENTAVAASCDLARSMVAHCQAEARRIIWDLRDTEDLTDSLSEALGRAMATHHLHETVKTILEIHGKEISIAPGAVHHLVCIGQEAVSNAVRHADAKSIQVTLRYESDSLSLSIRDDGRGFSALDSGPRTGHFGIAVMQERARKLGGHLRLISSASGTEVALTVSFHHINQAVKPPQDVVRWIGV